MKVVNVIVKVVVAMAAVAGVVYVVATYGDKIVAWAKKTLGACKCRCGDDECCCEETCCCEEAVCEEAPAEETPVAEGEAVAAEADFEG